MRTAVLVLGILGVSFSLMVGLCTGICFSTLGEMGKQTSSSAAAADATALGGQFILLGLVQTIVGLVGTVKAFRTFDEPIVKKVPVYCLGAGIFLSIFNTMQFFTSGLFFGIAILLIFLGGGKAPTTDPWQEFA